MTVYNFYTQNSIGRAGEVTIQHWLKSQGWTLRPVTMLEQQQGIDFWGTKVGCVATSFEIKTDRRAHVSGNAFVEVQGDATHGRLGWLFTCQADVLLYWIPGLSTVLWMEPKNIREAYTDWKELYELKEVSGATHITTGLLVPLSSFKTAATYIYKLGPQRPLTPPAA